MDAEIRAFFASLEAQPSYTRSTRLAYSSDLRLFSDYLKQNLERAPRLTDLTSETLIQFLESERKKGLKVNTLLRRKATLQCFERFLHKEGYLSKAQMDAKLPDTLTEQPTSEDDSSLHCLTEDEINCLQAYMRVSHRPVAQRDQAVFALLLETGLSVSTLIAMNIHDLDMVGKRFQIITSRKQDCWQPLAEAYVPLDLYLLQGRPDLNPVPGEFSLFISQLGARMSRQSIWQVLRNIGNGAGLGFTLSPRIVRHTAALHMFHNRRSMAEIQMLLGHTNPISTQALLNRLDNANPQGAKPSA